MKLIRLILICIFINLQLSIVECLAKGAGSSAGATLTQSVSAKAASMADAYSSLSGEVIALHYNPAGLSTLQESELSTMYLRGLNNDTLGSIIFGKNFSFGTIAASILYYDTGKIELYDLAENKISKIGKRDIIVTVGIGKSIFKEKVGLGLNIKGISSEIFGEKAHAFAADIGAQYHGLIDMGLSVQNVGTALTYIDKKESLPEIVRLGMSHTISFTQHAITTAVDVPYFINEEETLGLAGLEYCYDNLFSVRGGYRFNFTDSSRNDEQQVIAGIGLNRNNFFLDYSVGITKNLDIPHYISIRVKFKQRDHYDSEDRDDFFRRRIKF